MRKLELLRRRAAGETPHRIDRMTVKILETAADLFTLQGYGMTTLDQVIAKCGIGRDTLYRRFPTKLDLFLAVVRHVRADVARRFDTFSMNMTDAPIDRIKAAMHWLLDVNLEPRLIAFQRIAFSEAAVTGKAIADEPDRITLFLLAAIRDGQETGALSGSDPAHICSFLVNAIVIGPLMRAMLGDELILSARNREEIFQANWNMTMSGLLSRKN